MKATAAAYVDGSRSFLGMAMTERASPVPTLRGCAHCGVEGVIELSVAILALYCKNRRVTVAVTTADSGGNG